MVHLVPEEPRFATPSEQEVWTRLRDGLGVDDVLFADFRLTDQEKDHETDLIVLMPEVGILVLEVKGGNVWHDGDGWWTASRDDRARIRPVDQARDSKYALKRYVEADPRWGSRGHVAWAHGVVTPYSRFDNDFSVPELPRWALHDRGEQENLAERVRDNGWGLAHGAPGPNHDDVDLIVEILAGRAHTARDLNADAAARAAEANRLTQEQFSILQATRLLRRVEVRGGAGSGKTVLALQQAKELSGGKGERKAERVALVCYSIGLAEYLKREVGAWPRRRRPAFVGTFEELGRQWGVTGGDREDSAFWEEHLPRMMGERATQLSDAERFDSVIVDEAQDFADAWWEPIMRSLRDEAEGGLYVFSDENQRIFARFGRPPVQLIPLVLDHNLRNTRQIHEAFGPLAPSRMYARGGTGPDVRFVAATSETALEVADDQVDVLLDEGWDPGGLALITTGHRHPIQIEQTNLHGQVGYWRQFWEDDESAFYGHVLGCKGLERQVVVLCVNERGDRDRARERLYVGMSRATDLLVVVGDPAVISRIGGGVVAGRLGIEAARP